MPEANPERLRRLEQRFRIRLKTIYFLRYVAPCVSCSSSAGDSAQQFAALPCLHRRTLNRRLNDLGTNVQHVLDEIRFEAAWQLLDNTASRDRYRCVAGYCESDVLNLRQRRHGDFVIMSKMVKSHARLLVTMYERLSICTWTNGPMGRTKSENRSAKILLVGHKIPVICLQHGRAVF
jgi:AraC-like DNA-binding protein